MFGSGLQVDRQASSNTRNVYVPRLVKARGEGYYPYFSPPFYGSWENTVGAGVKKNPQKREKGFF